MLQIEYGIDLTYTLQLAYAMIDTALPLFSAKTGWCYWYSVRIGHWSGDRSCSHCCRCCVHCCSSYGNHIHYYQKEEV